MPKQVGQWAQRTTFLRSTEGKVHPALLLPSPFCFPLRERSFAEAFVVVVAKLVVRTNGLCITDLGVGINMRAYAPML